jgi:hypothetical protein
MLAGASAFTLHAPSRPYNEAPDRASGSGAMRKFFQILCCASACEAEGAAAERAVSQLGATLALTLLGERCSIGERVLTTWFTPAPSS